MDHIDPEEFLEDLEELSTAEAFLDYFDIDYEPELVERKHIQLLRLFQKLLSSQPARLSEYRYYHQTLSIAYRQLALGREPAFDSHGCQSCHSTECGSLTVVEEERP
ncbi:MULTISPECIES: nitrogenase-stabilizing/protective protein NifW [Vibrio]|uniref:Nitrogenase-stabilizing/protective protein NifW n=2 Tax=Vibrio TaxID=662 RepID=A0A7X4LK34_9VIBR|nr:MULTISPECIES: nitrogenase-stabilizing/protective protein NifW [Vibrio]MBF9002402.1 hypothetical protein [Vibrio nitrifigilis]MZI93016.1 hypothetical protein [Vibrio eleionomae]